VSAHTLYIESTMQSSTLVYDATCAGIAVSPLSADTDKVTRALPASARVDQGKVYLPAGAAWVGDYLDELAASPNSAHDDMVDVTSYAAQIVSKYYVAPIDQAPARRHYNPSDPLERAFDDLTRGVDFLKIPL
jgi:phage terminase large subunit-like protein